MSRYTKHSKDKTTYICYGFDNALGYFYEIWDKAKLAENPDARPVKDRCSAFGMTRDEMGAALKEYKVPAKHISALAADLPI
jgi:hypothetical protein